MLTPEQIENELDRILLKVQKPGRYVGGELNSVHKDWDAVQTKVAFVFPDIYDIGVSNVGLKILYDQVNQREDALAERAYAPWLDMEALMRERGIPLYTLESKRPLADFDLLALLSPMRPSTPTPSTFWIWLASLSARQTATRLIPLSSPVATPP
jgi:radical SAM family protein